MWYGVVDLHVVQSVAVSPPLLHDEQLSWHSVKPYMIGTPAWDAGARGLQKHGHHAIAHGSACTEMTMAAPHRAH